MWRSHNQIPWDALLNLPRESLEARYMERQWGVFVWQAAGSTEGEPTPPEVEPSTTSTHIGDPLPQSALPKGTYSEASVFLLEILLA